MTGCLLVVANHRHRTLTDMTSWRSLDESLNIGQVRWTWRLLCLVQILLFHVGSDATRHCSQSDPVNVRVATVFSASVVRARLLAVSGDGKNGTELTAAQFKVSRVFKSRRTTRLTAFTADVPLSDLQCMRVNASCLVFVNISVSVPHTGVRNSSAASGRVSRLTPWSRRALRYVRMHICQSQYCSK